MRQSSGALVWASGAEDHYVFEVQFSVEFAKSDEQAISATVRIRSVSGLDTAKHCLLRDGQPVPLTPKVFDLLKVLVQNNGRLVEKDELLKEVWPDSFVEEGNLNRNISILRKVLGEDSSGRTLYRDRSEARLSVCRQCEKDQPATALGQ